MIKIKWESRYKKTVFWMWMPLIVICYHTQVSILLRIILIWKFPGIVPNEQMKFFWNSRTYMRYFGKFFQKQDEVVEVIYFSYPVLFKHFCYVWLISRYIGWPPQGGIQKMSQELVLRNEQLYEVSLSASHFVSEDSSDRIIKL